MRCVDVGVGCRRKAQDPSVRRGDAARYRWVGRHRRRSCCRRRGCAICSSTGGRWVVCGGIALDRTGVDHFVGWVDKSILQPVRIQVGKPCTVRRRTSRHTRISAHKSLCTIAARADDKFRNSPLRRRAVAVECHPALVAVIMAVQNHVDAVLCQQRPQRRIPQQCHPAGRWRTVDGGSRLAHTAGYCAADHSAATCTAHWWGSIGCTSRLNPTQRSASRRHRNCSSGGYSPNR